MKSTPSEFISVSSPKQDFEIQFFQIERVLLEYLTYRLNYLKERKKTLNPEKYTFVACYKNDKTEKQEVNYLEFDYHMYNVVNVFGKQDRFALFTDEKQQNLIFPEAVFKLIKHREAFFNEEHLFYKLNEKNISETIPMTSLLFDFHKFRLVKPINLRFTGLIATHGKNEQ